MMGMFGNRKPQLPFGTQMPDIGSTTPPIAPVPQQPATLGMGYQPQQPQAFNAPGGWGDKLGNIGALLLSVGGNQAGSQMFQQIGQKRQQQMQQQQYERSLQDSRDTWLQQQQWEREHPKPINNDTVNDYQFISDTLGPDAAKNYLTNKTTAPPFVQHNADGTLEVFPSGMVPRGGVPAQSGPAPGTVDGGFRFKGGDYKNPANWEQVGGAGVRAPARFPDPMKAPGQMTSGRRTVLGNSLVGGVPNSGHLRGDKADYVGTTAAALQAYFGPNAHILDEHSHLDVNLPGYGQMPYFGARGTIGLKR